SSWIFFVKVSFALSLLALGTGIVFLPVDVWIRGYLAMGALFTVGSTVTMTKTMRDHHEGKKRQRKRHLHEEDPRRGVLLDAGRGVGRGRVHGCG
ncbi:MAG: YiaA/YiaB family inner membrane protein, partial [Bacteroidota bacterium]